MIVLEDRQAAWKCVSSKVGETAEVWPINIAWREGAIMIRLTGGAGFFLFSSSFFLINRVAGDGAQ